MHAHVCQIKIQGKQDIASSDGREAQLGLAKTFAFMSSRMLFLRGGAKKQPSQEISGSDKARR